MFLYKSKEKIRASFLFPLIKKPWGRSWSKKIFDKKVCTKSRRKITFLKEGALFIKDKKVISAKFSVNISRRYVMYVMFYHYRDKFWSSATFARFRNFSYCQLRESNPCHCSGNSINVTTIICNFSILISCSNTIPVSRPLFNW